MKKILLTIAIISTTACFAIAQNDTNYTQKYIDNFKSCTPYTETYNMAIQTQDPNTPILHLRSKETIIGKQNGKCATESSVFNQELNREIMIVNCNFTQEQLNSMASKMEKATSDPEIKKQLQEEITNYIQNDPNTCQVKNLLEEPQN